MELFYLEFQKFLACPVVLTKLKPEFEILKIQSASGLLEGEILESITLEVFPFLGNNKFTSIVNKVFFIIKYFNNLL